MAEIADGNQAGTLCPICLAFRWANDAERLAHNNAQHGGRRGTRVRTTLARPKHLKPRRGPGGVPL